MKSRDGELNCATICLVLLIVFAIFVFAGYQTHSNYNFVQQVDDQLKAMENQINKLDDIINRLDMKNDRKDQELLQKLQKQKEKTEGLLKEMKNTLEETFSKFDKKVYENEQEFADITEKLEKTEAALHFFWLVLLLFGSFCCCFLLFNPQGREKPR